MNKNIKKVEKKVLKNYNNVPPYEKVDATRLEMFYKDNLKLPKEVFFKRFTLDVGCGDGAKTKIYDKNFLSYGYGIDIVDNPYEKASLFDYKPKFKYGMVICDGVLHHTADGEFGFKKLCSFLDKKEDGWIIISVINKSGQTQRALIIRAIKKLGNTNDQRYRAAKRLFPTFLKRAKKYGHREARQVIYDDFLNPQLDSYTNKEIMKWFYDNGIKFYSSYPHIYEGCEDDWKCMKEINKPVDCHIGFGEELKEFNLFLKENHTMNEYISKIKTFKHLFKGMCGLGSVYYVGYKTKRGGSR